MLRILASRRRVAVLRELTASLYVYMLAAASGRRGWDLVKAAPQEQSGGEACQLTIPYGVAIFIGVCLGATTVHLWMT